MTLQLFGHAFSSYTAKALIAEYENEILGPDQPENTAELARRVPVACYGVSQARTALDTIYWWLDQTLAKHLWAAGDAFTLAGAAAAPSLFYADWRLFSRPSFAQRRRRPSLSALLPARHSRSGLRPGVQS